MDKPETRPRQSTMLRPLSLPRGFNFAIFILGLTTLNQNLKDVLRLLDEATKRGEKKEINKLEVLKKQREEALMAFLVKAYEETNGEIVKIPEFDRRNEEQFKLALKDDFQTLWLKVKLTIQKMREAQHEKLEQIIPENEPKR